MGPTNINEKEGKLYNRFGPAWGTRCVVSSLGQLLAAQEMDLVGT